MDAAAVELDFRAQRGLAIVKDKGAQIRQIVEDKYLVPSQTLTSSGYVVDVTAASCTCPDYAELGGVGREHRCKHLWAVLYVRREVTMPDGSVVVSKKKVVLDRRDFRKYNPGQREETPRARVLLKALYDGIVPPPYRGNGRPCSPLNDVLFGATMKVWNKLSARRAEGDATEWRKLGYVKCVPHFNTILNLMEDPTITPLLQVLIMETAAPLVAFEKEQAYAADGTGFATGVYGSYCEHKHGVTKQKKHRHYIKTHVIAGTYTHAVTYVAPTDGRVSDMEMLPELVQQMAKRFPVKEVSADKGYLSKMNAQIIASCGAVPYIMFRDNSTGTKGPEGWNTMWHSFSGDREEYLRHYHRRSNVETVFHMVKAKFGERLLMRTRTAQFNEVLLKYVCHNISCLAMAFKTLGIDPKFERIFAEAGRP